MSGDSTTVDKVYDAAQLWLGLVDAGKYDRSWEEAAARFKSLVEQEDWRRKAGGVRSPLGKVMSRFEQSREQTRTLPGAPDGEYVVFKFTTSFEHKNSATETLTLTHEPDGVWRVSGYFIH